MKAVRDLAALAGRVLLVVMFLTSGIGKLTALDNTAGSIAGKGLPFPSLLAAGAAAVEIVAPILIVIGWHTRLAALALAIFIAVITPVFHDYWTYAEEAARRTQYISFWKNTSLFGAFLLLVAHGAGGWSVDARRARA
jgi:putative oxidoreductase